MRDKCDINHRNSITNTEENLKDSHIQGFIS